MQLNLFINFDTPTTEEEKAEVIQKVAEALLTQVEDSETGLAPEGKVTCSFTVSDTNGEQSVSHTLYTPPYPNYWGNMLFQPDNGEAVSKAGVFDMLVAEYPDWTDQMVRRATALVWDALDWEHPSTVISRFQRDEEELFNGSWAGLLKVGVLTKYHFYKMNLI